MTNAWLQQQRKGALSEIADHVGLKKCAPTLFQSPLPALRTLSIAYHSSCADTTSSQQQRRAVQKDRPGSRTRRAPTRQQLQTSQRLESRSLLLHRRPLVAHKAGSRDRHRTKDGREREEAAGEATNYQGA